ncbi:MAG: hypothetical protein KKA07_03915, partial [Bacteroidetes bacterium]|nr:hypothetical protein [Bacteroidota bacterium]
MKKAFLTILISLVCLLMMRPAGAQTLKYSQQALQFERTKEINVSSIRTDWFVSFRNLEKPLVGNNGYKRMLEAAKLEISRRYPRRTDRYSPSYTNFTTDTPIVHRNFEGNVFSNSVPNDNTMAISNSGKLVSAINTNIRFYDIALDSLEATISLTAFSDTLQLNNSQYDPKLIYDPSEDRFIIVYLAGNKDSTSNIIVGFSTSPDPTQTWNLYYLPGNPLNDTSWSDYPAIGLTGDELFITMNLLENEGEWQTAFKQSVIWQVNKFDGYAGTTLNTLLWTDIVFGGTNIRNMHPVRGGSQLYGPDMYFLSNKNFAIQSDSIFMIHIDGNISGTPQLTVDLLHSDVAYGMPPVARQTGIHTLETNDARMLGAFIENSNIQFVFNCVDTTTGFAGFYHGVISDVGGANTVSGNIISDTLLDFGYPNIAYCGDGAGDNRSVITFNHSGTAEYPGFSAMYYNGSGVFSKYTMIARGNTYINVLSGAYERWGDYSGIQRKYNETGI